VLFDVSERVALIRNTSSMASQQLNSVDITALSHRQKLKSEKIEQAEREKLEKRSLLQKKITAALRPFVAAQAFHYRVYI
jgi:hypothetical protein